MDEDDTIFDYPQEVLKAALGWVPQERLYGGIVETIDYLVAKSDDEDEPLDILTLLGVLFEASVMGRCFHEAGDEEDADPAPSFTEEDAQAFARKLGLEPEE